MRFSSVFTVAIKSETSQITAKKQQKQSANPNRRSPAVLTANCDGKSRCYFQKYAGCSPHKVLRKQDVTTSVFLKLLFAPKIVLALTAFLKVNSFAIQ